MLEVFEVRCLLAELCDWTKRICKFSDGDIVEHRLGMIIQVSGLVCMASEHISHSSASLTRLCEGQQAECLSACSM